MRFRAKRNEERERGVQIVGTAACFRNRTRRKRGELFLFLFFLVNFSSDLLGSWLWIILETWILLRPPARSKLTGSSAAFFSFFCLFLFFVLFLLYVFFFCLLLSLFCLLLCHVFFSYSYHIRSKAKKLFHSPPFTTFAIFHVTRHVTAFDQ